MLLKITIKSPVSYFYGITNQVGIRKGWYYPTTILPSKTTILGMICFYYWYEFSQIKNELLSNFKFGIQNNSINLKKEIKRFTSRYKKTNVYSENMELWEKEYLYNLDIIIYCYIKPQTNLEKIIKESTHRRIPGIGDRDLTPEIFEVEEIRGYELKKDFISLENFSLTNVVLVEDTEWILTESNSKKYYESLFSTYEERIFVMSLIKDQIKLREQKQTRKEFINIWEDNIYLLA